MNFGWLAQMMFLPFDNVRRQCKRLAANKPGYIEENKLTVNPTIRKSLQ